MSILERSSRELLIAGFAILALIVFIPIFTYFYFAQDLNSKEGIMNRSSTGVVLLDRQNRPFFTFYQASYKTSVPLLEIPKQVQHAIIAIEDKDFYYHPGFSVRGIVRSLFTDITKHEIASGGSTITQQLVKNALLNSSKNFLRKYQEIILAEEIERRYPKDEILEMYVNSVYFGEGAFGIEEAAKKYFDKEPKDLSLGESALLAGLLPSPSKLSPLSGNIAGATERQHFVLEAMVNQHYISEEQKKAAEQEKLTFKSAQNNVNSIAPHFALMVREELIRKFGEEQISRSGFKVTTSIDLDWQKYAEEVVANQVLNLRFNKVSNGATVVIDPKTGEIKVLVGSKDWYDNQFGKVNIATSLRQPGSSFKPIVYATALEKHLITPATILSDKPTTYKSYDQIYSPKNYDGKFRGPVTARRALANSLNVPSVEVMSKVGVPDALSQAQRFGITTLKDPSNYGLSLVLGAGEVKLLELTSAYAVFANQGKKIDPVTILKIEDKHNQTMYEYKPEPKQIIQPEYAFLISSILSDNNARLEVFGNTLTISRPAAVKTGTTENYRDAWTMGYTPSLAVGVWVGNNDGTSMDNIAGSLGAAPIWRALMEKFLQGTLVEQFTSPSSIVRRTVCTFTKDATFSAVLTEYFAQGTEPLKDCFVPTPTTQSNPTTSTPAPNPPTSSPLPTATPTPLIPAVHIQGINNSKKNKD